MVATIRLSRRSGLTSELSDVSPDPSQTNYRPVDYLLIGAAYVAVLGVLAIAGFRVGHALKEISYRVERENSTIAEVQE